MADIKSKEERSRNMAAIKGKDTKPEMIVRKYIFSKGLRYRIHVKSLPGNPDIVLPKYKTVVFINGCFWHGHDACKYFRLPKSNIEFWDTKIKNNKNRDIINEERLKEAGWKVIRIWECEIKKVKDREKILETLYKQIITSHIPYLIKESPLQVAAEPSEAYGKDI